VTDTRLTVMLLHRDELVIIAPPHHPLAKMKSAAVADVAKFPLVLPKAGHTRDALENLFHERRLKPRYAEAHYNLALALHQEGKEAESHAEFEKAYEIAPELRNSAARQ